MLLATRTVTINPAFLHEIKEDNVELREVLAQLVNRLLQRRQRPADARTLVEMLGRLRDQLAIHFSLEEAFGYFENATAVAPRLSRQAEELRSEHNLFFRDICSICEQAEQLLYHEVPGQVLRQIAARFAAFHDAFQLHESRERELIMAAFDDDIGVCD
jgi:hypothetical protein